ncbi:coiled-coil domain-containing protein 115 isoform X2 [Abrus precatorius]|uniref:Vacuolar ATPase assembly protein VMA22 n=1 Tax=Abrus precatorius TaxID=3816 RepID=A0A8B8LIA3_ABRPR|nr:coiled-coil domain-containing protein 115 isoform X2 [Abrus precatorius]
MEKEDHQYCVNGEEPQIQEPEKEDEEKLEPEREDAEKLVLQFMDSMHNYLALCDAFSCTLRQGWLDLASARHSMGGSRINSSLLDLKFHSASTTVEITNSDGTQPCFKLRKWVSSENVSTQLEDENMQPRDSSDVKSSDNDEVQKERSKSLSVFGILISPKLRATQLSFERALETLVEIANVQSSLLYSFHRLHQEVEDTKE